MGFLDDAAKVANQAFGALGAQGKAASDSTEKPERGETLIKPENSPRGSFGNDPTDSANPNPVPSDPIEFIHYSLVHADDGQSFHHAPYNPPAGGKGDPPRGRGIMFRDALERESLLLHGYLNSCKIVLSEYLRNRGPIGDAAAVVGGLLGGGPSAPKPDAAQLDTYAAKVKAAGESIKPATVDYQLLHQAGADLHQARANYKQFLKSLHDYYLKPSDGKGPLGALDKAVGSLPGPAKILMTVQKIGFSMFDIYLGCYLEMQQAMQRQIELASHQLTIDAILNKYEKHALTFPIWGPVTEVKEEIIEETTEGEEKKKGAGFSKEVDFLKPVKDQAKKLGNEVDKIKEDIYDFAGVNSGPKETIGTAPLAAIFSTLKGGESGKDAGSATTILVKALNAALASVGGMPSFLEFPIRQIMNANLGLLEEVYKRLTAQPTAEMATAPIRMEMLETAGRRHLEQMLVALPVELLVSLLPAKIGGGGSDFALGGVSAKQMAAHQFEEKLGKGGVGQIVNKVLGIAIGQLADNLETIRARAAAERCLTMEIFLGRLPWLITLMFRNTFFVMWNDLVKVAFGPAATFLEDATQQAGSVIDKGKDAVDTAEEAQRRAKKLNEVKDQGVSVGPKGDNLGNYKDAVEDETEEGKKRAEERAAERNQGNAIAAFKRGADPNENFPVDDRVPEGEGLRVLKEVPSILPEAA